MTKTTRAITSAWAERPIDGQERQDYGRSTRLLFGALGRLASTGYPAPPDEGLDLIHDFLLDVWSGLSARYDPSRAKLDTYMFACFVTFARPRILRLRRLRSTLVAPAEIAGLVIDDADEGSGTDLADRRAAGRALERLPAGDRALLIEYLDDERSSERNIAAKHGLTRYALRLRLADALGRVAADLGELGAFPEAERAAALALWRDNRTVKEAAAILDRPAADIQAARDTAFRRLAQATKGHGKMTDSSSVDDVQKQAIEALLRAALGPEATALDLDALSADRSAVWHSLGLPDNGTAVGKTVAFDAGRLAEVYRALGGTLPDRDVGGWFEASADNQHAVGKAFGGALLPSLATPLADVAGFFWGVPVADEAVQDLLWDDASVLGLVAAGGEEPARALVAIGLTPGVVAGASRSLSNLAFRACEDHGVGLRDRLALERAGRPCSDTATLSRESAVRQLTRSVEVSGETVTRLADWLVEMAGCVPSLFDGFRAHLSGERILLERTDASEPDLYRRWNGGGDPAPHEGSPSTGQAAVTAVAASIYPDAASSMQEA